MPAVVAPVDVVLGHALYFALNPVELVDEAVGRGDSGTLVGLNQVDEVMTFMGHAKMV